jgi:hypothetical protein
MMNEQFYQIYQSKIYNPNNTPKGLRAKAPQQAGNIELYIYTMVT